MITDTQLLERLQSPSLENGYPMIHDVSIPVFTHQIPTIVAHKATILDYMAKNNGCGLAGIQIGIPLRFFIIRDRMIFNPVIERHGKQTLDGNEGCLSFPGKNINVPRYAVIDVKYFDETGTICNETLKGINARIFQHEYDHLDGKTIV